jgi:serine/threonine protein kinase
MLEQLAHYKVLDRIGSGGLGEVYRARDLRLGRTVAIRVLPAFVNEDPESSDADRRLPFLRDANAALGLSHPNIAALYEVGEEGGGLFLVFEFVPGEPLSKIIAGRPLNPRRAIQFAVQVADALAEAHAIGIIHGAIEPDNIFVTPRGNAKVLDFGIAARKVRAAARSLAYMAPEQARGETIDQRTDTFSLGAVLYEMLVGLPPFQGKMPAALALVDPVVSRALEENVDNRFQSAAIFAAELRAVHATLEQRAR